MSCKNCYNGCTEITSDKCIKYTGIDIPELNIENGDTLEHVEQQLINTIVSLLDGSNINLNIPQEIICEVVDKYLPSCSQCTGISITDIITALIKAVCYIETEVGNIFNWINEIDSEYNVDCLTGIADVSKTHDVLQAAINKICSISTDLEALALDVRNNYVPIIGTPGYPGINEYIQTYLDDNLSTNLIKNKMVPYSVLPYYGPLTNFDGTGAGTGNWIDIYLCNGSNGTPDLRGRTLVGATSGMFGGVLDPEVNPSNPLNPPYVLSGSIPPFFASNAGNNFVTLDQTQIPAHTHTATVAINDPGHKHTYYVQSSLGVSEAGYIGNTSAASAKETTVEDTGITVNVTNSSTGGGQPHNNTQPSTACYYIIYIP